MTHVDKFCLHVQGFFQPLTTPLFMRVCCIRVCVLWESLLCVCVGVCVCVCVCVCAAAAGHVCACVHRLAALHLQHPSKSSTTPGTTKNCRDKPEGKGGGRRNADSLSLFIFFVARLLTLPLRLSRCTYILYLCCLSGENLISLNVMRVHMHFGTNAPQKSWKKIKEWKKK